MATNKINKKVAHELNQKVASGFHKHLAKSGTVFFNNKKWNAKEVDSDLQRRSGGEDAVQAARVALHAAVLERDKIEDQTAEVFDGIRTLVIAMFGSSPEILADFGLAPRKKRRSMKLDEKVGAVEKAQQTKAARHVMGKRQRLQIRAEGTAPAARPTAQAPVPAPAVIPPTPITPAPAAIPPNPITPVTNGAPVVNGAASGGGQ